MTIRVLIADDQMMISESLAVLLNAQSDIEVVGTAQDGEQAVRMVVDMKPDVVLMDVRMPNVDGIEATRRIAGTGSPTRIIILTTFDLDEYVFEALRAGASGFLLKTSSAHRLADAVRTVTEGGALLAPSVTRRMIEEFSRIAGAPRQPRMEKVEDLTARETEVLCLIARGMSNQEIAAHLVIAEQTVKSHVSRLLIKLGLRDRTQAAVYAYETGLVVAGG